MQNTTFHVYSQLGHTQQKYCHLHCCRSLSQSECLSALSLSLSHPQVFILYFKPSTFRCILLRWVRMLGFSIVYGTVTLKMYRWADDSEIQRLLVQVGAFQGALQATDKLVIRRFR